MMLSILPFCLDALSRLFSNATDTNLSECYNTTLTLCIDPLPEFKITFMCSVNRYSLG